MLGKLLESISYALCWAIWRLKSFFLSESDVNPRLEIPLRERPKESLDSSLKGKFVGSLRSKRKRYHLPGCRYALGLSNRDKIWFANPEQAQKADYEACRFCVTEE
jgi:hypothetical protein